MANYDQISSPQSNLENAMKATQLLHKKLLSACPDMHKIRLKALIAGVNSALSEHQVTVTGLGRNLRDHSKTKTKHDIKRMDRLIAGACKREKIGCIVEGTNYCEGESFKYGIFGRRASFMPGSEYSKYKKSVEMSFSFIISAAREILRNWQNIFK